MPVTHTFLRQVFDLDRPPASSRLLALSSLTDAEVPLFRSYWQDAELIARSRLIDRLVSLAEDNAEADFDPVFRLALEDVSSAIREKAIDALWECRERWLLNRLTIMAETDPSEEVRAAASGALGKFVLLGALEEIRASLVEKVETCLKGIIGNASESVQVRRRAIEAIGPSPDPAVNDIIRDAYHGDQLDLKLAALYAMGQHCDPGWLPVLLAELKNPDPALRYEAARACGELEDERAVASLIALTREPDPEIQHAAIEALGRIGGNEAKRALRHYLSQPDTRLRDAAKSALEELSLDEDPFSRL